MNLATQSKLENRIINTMSDLSKASPMESITTGMLSLLSKPGCTKEEFAALLDHLEQKGLLVGIPKGKTKKWRLN